MQSIRAAESAHGIKYKGITNEDEKALITEKTAMKFKDDEFMRNDLKT